MRLQITGRKVFHLVILPLVIAIAAFEFSSWAVEQPTALNGLAVEDAQRADSFQKYAPASSKIVLVTYDESTETRLGLPINSPLPRSKYAELLQLLDQAGAKVALVDVEFRAADPPESAQADEKHSGALRSVLKSLKTLRVTLGAGPDEDKTDANRPVPAGPFYDVAVCGSTTDDRVRLGSMFGEQSATNSLLIGGYPIQWDTSKNRKLLYAPLSAALQFYDIPVSDLESDYQSGRLVAGSYEWALNPNNAIDARWTKSPSGFRRFEFLDALAALRDPARRKAFEKKIVIVGSNTDQDIHDTPAFGRTHGVDFVTQMTNTILLPSKHKLFYAPEIAFDIYCVVLGWTGFLGMRFRRPHVNLLCFSSLVGFCFGVQVLSAKWLYWIVPTVLPMMVLIFCSVSGLILGRYWTDYVDLSPPGETEQATILFLDIKQSTVLLSKIGRLKYQRLLQELFHEYGLLVERFGGHIERTLGDGFMAVFRETDSEHQATRCALCCQKLVEATARVGERLGVKVNVALGFETGMVGGHYVTEGGKRTWSSSGRVIHLSQRLQSLCGPLAISVAVGPVARQLLSEDVICQSLGRHPAQGFSEDFEVFELLVNASSEAPWNVSTSKQ